MILPLVAIAATVIVAMAIILIIIAKQLKDARYTLILNLLCMLCHTAPPVTCVTVLAMCSLLSRTQLRKLSEPQTNQGYDSPAGLTYENVNKMDVGGASDHTYIPAMELSQCPAYIPTEMTTGRGGRRDVGEEGIYDN